LPRYARWVVGVPTFFMPGRRVSVRPTVFHQITNAPEKRETATEYTVLALGILTNFIFVIGCVLFFEEFSPKVNDIGLLLFLIGSLMNVFLSGYAMWEHRHASQTFEVGARDEFFEHLLYVSSGIFFAVGSVLWMPVWGENKTHIFIGHAGSAWCFIWGSMVLVLASVWNAFGLVDEHSKKDELPSSHEIMCRRLASIALCCTALGGALFVAGSFMFRPAFENDCSAEIREDSREDGPGPWRRSHHVGFLQAGASMWDPSDPSRVTADSMVRLTAFCLGIINQGTWVYLWGCTLFFAQSVISLFVCVTMNNADSRPKMNLVVNRRSRLMMVTKSSQTEGDPPVIPPGAEKSGATIQKDLSDRSGRGPSAGKQVSFHADVGATAEAHEPTVGAA